MAGAWVPPFLSSETNAHGRQISQDRHMMYAEAWPCSTACLARTADVHRVIRWMYRAVRPGVLSECVNAGTDYPRKRRNEIPQVTACILDWRLAMAWDRQPRGSSVGGSCAEASRPVGLGRPGRDRDWPGLVT